MLDGGPGFEIDIDAVNRNVAEAEVISIYFPRLRKTLLLDTRTTDEVGPFIAVVDMVDDASQRFLSLRKLRPQLPRPQSITLIPWVLRVDSLRQTGVWGRLVERLRSCGDESCLEAAGRCIDELQALERLEVVRALTGEQHRTLWGRQGVGDAEEEAD